jgi:lipopolysaccharide-induced tumor necrosis factor-alpha factor
MSYAGTPQYPGTGVLPPGQYYQQQKSTIPYNGGDPYYPAQQQITPGYQFAPGLPQTIPQQSGAPLTATPISALNRSSAPVDCPVCGTRALTATRKVVGSTNQLSLFLVILWHLLISLASLWAAVLCFFCGLGCIPYLLNDLKDVEHSCSNCGAHLATYYKSGGTEPMVR